MSDKISAEDAIRAIHTVMSGSEWSADTLEAIAGVVEAAGYKIAELD